MSIPTDTPVYSIDELLETYKNTSYPDDIILGFISELTGVSEDRLFELSREPFAKEFE